MKTSSVQLLLELLPKHFGYVFIPIVEETHHFPEKDKKVKEQGYILKLYYIK